MKPRKTLSVYVLLVGVLGLSIIGGVLAFQIFSAATKSQLTSAQAEIIKPIDGTIDQKIIDNLDKRTVITETEIKLLVTSSPANTNTTITPTIAPTLTATDSAEQTATESAQPTEQ